MNYIKHLTGFFDRVVAEKTFNATHVSIYISLFQFWNFNRFRSPISISRDEVMRISKISSKATYHKCLKELHHNGYIKYEPSYNPFKGSQVFMFNFADDLKPLTKAQKSASSNFEPVTKQVPNKLQTANRTSTEQVVGQAVVPYINNTNSTNNTNNSNGVNLDEPEKKMEEGHFDLKETDEEKEKKLRKKKKSFSNAATSIKNNYQSEDKVDSVIPSAVEVPKPNEVLAYFREQEWPEIEANKFFNYFQSIGWLVGGKTPMTDWQAAARNWMLNAPKFISHERTDRTKHLDTSAGKDYSEPL